jgi:hypothetical protein
MYQFCKQDMLKQELYIDCSGKANRQILEDGRYAGRPYRNSPHCSLPPLDKEAGAAERKVLALFLIVRTVHVTYLQAICCVIHSLYTHRGTYMIVLLRLISLWLYKENSKLRD